MTVLIRNATVITMDGEHGTDPWQADILVEGDRIADVGPGLAAAGAQVIDASRRLAIPGS